MILLKMSLSGALLVLFVVSVRAFIKNRLPKKLLWILWFIVIVRLLVPISFFQEWSIFSVFEQRISSDSLQSSVQREETDWSYDRFNSMEDQELRRSDWNPRPAVFQGENDEENNSDFLFKEPRKDRIVAVLFGIWATGFLLALTIVSGLYCKHLKGFRNARELEKDAFASYLGEKKLKRKIIFRISKEIDSPLTYGILKPTILLPETMFAHDEKELNYILFHEYIHIRHFDSLSKLVLTFVLCLHWFNPAVWWMYFLANRDIELICDESVVNFFGREEKADYARALISAEERKLNRSANSVLYSNFGKEDIEERIVSIMKTKKTSGSRKALSCLILFLVAVLFACSNPDFDRDSSEKGKGSSNPPESKEQGKESAVTEDHQFISLGKAFSESEIQRLQSLQYDGYKTMSVAEFQQKVLKDLDNSSDAELMERVSFADFLKSDTHGDLVHYLQTTLIPLTSETWEERGILINGYANYVRGDKVDTEQYENMMNAYPPVEYSIKLSILDKQRVLVKEYEELRKRVEEEVLETIFAEYDNYGERTKNKTDKTLPQGYDAEKMRENFREIEKKYSDGNFKVEISDSIPEDADFVNVTETNLFYEQSSDSMEKEVEKQIQDGVQVTEGTSGEFNEDFETPTKRDIEALLKLMEKDYERKSLSDFNQKVLEFSNADYGRTERLNAYVYNEGYLKDKLGLSDAENHFIKTSFMLSGMENAAKIKGAHTGKKREDTIVASPLYVKQFNTKERNSWCHFSFRFRYRIADADHITVKERDESVQKMLALTSDFWNESNLEALLKLEKKDLIKKLEAFAEQCSTDKIKLTLQMEEVQFETLNEHIKQ